MKCEDPVLRGIMHPDYSSVKTTAEDLHSDSTSQQLLHGGSGGP